jgi:hypothetical protein
LDIGLEKYEEMWGAYGTELGLMFKAFEATYDWTKPYQPNVVTVQDLGIEAGELVGLRSALVKVRDQF